MAERGIKVKGESLKSKGVVVWCVQFKVTRDKSCRESENGGWERELQRKRWSVGLNLVWMNHNKNGEEI
jgi:hypothetical protein